jgi:1,4-dihydroxy-2-naphthoate octaprenyltransferase
MGSANARIYHTVLVLGGASCLIAFGVTGPSGWTSWLFLLTMPVFLMHLKRVWSAAEPHSLDPQLKVLAMGTFLTALLFALGLILA